MKPLDRRSVLRSAGAAVLGTLGGGWLRSPTAQAADADRRPGIPKGYERVDPRTARKVPLTMSLRRGVPSYPGDPVFAVQPRFIDTRTPAHDDGGYLLERITSLGTHTASHISAPVHFVLGGDRLDQIGEDWTLMPLAVLDVRARIADSGSHFTVSVGDLRRWETRQGRIPRAGCVLLLTGYAKLFDQGSGEASPYITTPAPGFRGDAVDWLYEQRGITAIGADTLGPDATADVGLQATTSALSHGGITVENVGPRLAQMRPHGDWINVNGNRPPFSGFQMGFTGYTLPQS